MDKRELREWILGMLLGDAPKTINAAYEALDRGDMEGVRRAIQQHTDWDPGELVTRGDVLLTIINIKGLSGIQLTPEERHALDSALAQRKQMIIDGEWHPGYRWDGEGFQFDEDEPYIY